MEYYNYVAKVSLLSLLESDYSESNLKALVDTTVITLRKHFESPRCTLRRNGPPSAVSQDTRIYVE